jgi:hypothetical protein
MTGERDLATIWTWSCGGITALISFTACGITCDGIRWCECGGGRCYLGTADPCEHLRDLELVTARNTR